MDEGDHLLLYTDGVSETLADDDGRAEERFTSIDRPGCPKAERRCSTRFWPTSISELAGRPQPDDLTLLTATVLSPGR